MGLDAWEKDRKKFEEKHGFAYPKWSTMRKKLKDWGGDQVARDTVDIFNAIVREKAIPPNEIDALFRPIVSQALALKKIDKQERLTSEYVIMAIKMLDASLFELNIFQLNTFKQVIKRRFRIWFDNIAPNDQDIHQLDYLACAPYVYPQEKKALIDFFVENLSFPLENEKYAKLRKRLDKLEKKDNNSIEFQKVLDKVCSLDHLRDFYKDTLAKFSKIASKEQIKKFKRKFERTNQIQGKNFMHKYKF